MERTNTVTANVPKFSGKATDQHAGGNLDELVLPQRGVSFERLNNIMNLSPVRLLHAFLRVLTFSICFIRCRTKKELVILLHRLMLGQRLRVILWKGEWS